ncbi:lmo2511 protein [Clostridium sp. CAG:628]|jgi:putative sigma-54 modulation protein|nr:lmo2511 protein [Clostridium sp. CAG:628]
MKYTIRGQKLEVTDAIRDYAISKIDKMEKYFENPDEVSVKVVFSIRGREQKVEITINSINFDLRSEVSHSDMYAAIDLAVDKLEQQMRKFKSKLMSKERVEIVYDEDIIDDDVLEEVVKRKKVYLKPMDEEEAIMQMELLGHTFFVFKDIKTEKVNVLYKRLDGAYGVIETN